MTVVKINSAAYEEAFQGYLCDVVSVSAGGPNGRMLVREEAGVIYDQLKSGTKLPFQVEIEWIKDFDAVPGPSYTLVCVSSRK